MRTFIPFLLVGAGGFIGSMMRYLVTVFFQDFQSIPYGTLISNLSGCFLIGIITGVSAGIPQLSNEARLFLATGVCGGFTTLSSFIYELAEISRSGDFITGSFYFAGTLAGAAFAFYLGLSLVNISLRA